MSDLHRSSWLERWWPLLLIAFGLIFTLCLTLYRPQHEWSAVPSPMLLQTAAGDRLALGAALLPIAS